MVYAPEGTQGKVKRPLASDATWQIGVNSARFTFEGENPVRADESHPVTGIRYNIELYNSVI